MIRNVVLVKLKAGADAAEVAEIQDGFRNLGCPGTEQIARVQFELPAG